MTTYTTPHTPARRDRRQRILQALEAHAAAGTMCPSLAAWVAGLLKRVDEEGQKT